MEQLERQLADLHASSWAWATSCCGDREEAEEILQTVYLMILDGRARYGGRSSFKTWLFAVIRRTAASRRRRAAVRRALLDRWLPEPQGAPEEDAERRVLLGERAARVRQALADLSRRQREVVELVFYHDLTLRQASAVLGLSIGSVRTHYARGKSELARRLAVAEGR